MMTFKKYQWLTQKQQKQQQHNTDNKYYTTQQHNNTDNKYYGIKRFIFQLYISSLTWNFEGLLVLVTQTILGHFWPP